MAKEFTVVDRASLNNCLSWLVAQKQPFTITVKSKRSLPANALFHVWCSELAAHLSSNAVELGLIDDNGQPYSYTKETVKLMMKKAHGVWVKAKNPITGRIEQYPKSTADYDNSEMYQLMQNMKSNALHIWGYHLESKGEYLEWCEQQL